MQELPALHVNVAVNRDSVDRLAQPFGPLDTVGDSAAVVFLRVRGTAESVHAQRKPPPAKVELKVSNGGQPVIVENSVAH